MKCPNCGHEVNENMSLCSNCGNSLYGPRSINLSDVGGGNNTIQSNNITSITGIDINDITPVQTKPQKNTKNSKIKMPKIDKGKFTLDFSTIIFIIIVVVLLSVCISLFVQNNKLKELGGTIVNPPVNNESCVEGYYGLTSTYSFLLPENWIYSQTANEVVVTNQNLSILVFKYRLGKIDQLTSEGLKNEYLNQSYVVTIEENTLNNHKVMYVKYSTNNTNFMDFYYQYDSEKIIYGQVTSSESNLLTDDVKNVISSLTIQTRENNITVSKAPIVYDNVFALINQ